ncbi:MAG: MFS transporter [Deltaproteobacteria bacterium]|nr:MFS transporter [Deltaproteobacteria bacterium]
MQDPHARRDATYVSALYLSLFASFGLFGPFSALYLRLAGLSAAGATMFLAFTRLLRVVSTPVWTTWVDARSSPRQVLLWTSLPTALLFLWMFVSAPGVSWLVCFAAFIALRGPAVSLCDVLALDAAKRADTSYGRLRLFGTVGYCTGAFAAGWLQQRGDLRAALALTLVATLLGALSVSRLPKVKAPPRQGILRDLRTLFSQRRYVVLLLCAALHQLGLGAYDMLYAPWASAQIGGTVVGLSIALGGIAEVLFMAGGGGWLRRVGPRGVLTLAFVVSALRWFAMSRTQSAWVMVALQASHAFTFGAFYLASIDLIEAETPRTVRASAQGIFTMSTFGVAAALGLAVAAPLQRTGGFIRVMQASSAAALMAALIAWLALGPVKSTHPATSPGPSQV